MAMAFVLAMMSPLKITILIAFVPVLALGCFFIFYFMSSYEVDVSHGKKLLCYESNLPFPFLYPKTEKKRNLPFHLSH